MSICLTHHQRNRAQGLFKQVKRLAHLLKHAFPKLQVLCEALAAILQVNAHQRLTLKLLLGHCMSILSLQKPNYSCLHTSVTQVREKGSQK